MSLTKESPKWKQYEWLITKIFHEKSSSNTELVLHNAKIIGKYSETSRQIDILIENNNIRTMIECKHHSRPLDLKGLADFLEIFSDVKADIGILISSSGFTKSVVKRIKEFDGKITLDSIDWKKAYSSFQEHGYGRISDVCNNCIGNYKSGEEVPGLLCWQHGYIIEVDGIASMYSIGKCLKCHNHTVYCDVCGLITIAEDEEKCCEIRDIFIKCYKETIYQA